MRATRFPTITWLNKEDGPWPLDARTASTVRNQTYIWFSLTSWLNSFGIGFSVHVVLCFPPLSLLQLYGRGLLLMGMF